MVLSLGLLCLGACNTVPPDMTEPPKAEDDSPYSLGIDFRVSPDSGPVEGGTIVTVVGKNFVDGTSVEFGLMASPEVHVLNDQLLTAVTPPGDPGVTDLILRYPNGGQGAVSVKPVIVTGAFTYYVLPPDDGTDTDADGLTDVFELTGWEVWVDAFGLGLGADTFGNVSRYTCISDPTHADTDGDGLTDADEYAAKSDARKSDSDGDGLMDYEEVMRWRTSPTNIDSDGDSRGSGDTKLAPNPELFDGNELQTVGFESDPTDLFISEYLEGVNLNRAVEIFNPTAAPINLAAAQIRLAIYQNDGTGVGSRLNLTGIVPAGGTLVVAHPNSDADIRARANMLGALTFDGTQAIGLERGSATIDSMGTSASRLGAEQPDTSQEQRSNSQAFSSEFWQEFVPNATGNLRAIFQAITNTGAGAGSLQFRVFRGATLIAETHVSYGSNPSQTILVAGFDVPVQSGETLRYYMANSAGGGILAGYQSGDVYPNGACSLGASDFTFSTYVAPLIPQTDGTRSMRDQALRRDSAFHGVDTNLADAVRLQEFQQTSPGDYSGLGRFVLAPAARVIGGGTSPSLADTDGDGLTDYDELASATRDPLLAELPRVAVEMVGPVDMRLNVEYAEESGRSREYGTEISQGTNQTTSNSTSQSIEATLGIATKFGTKVVAPWAGEANFEVNLSASVTTGGTWESSTSTETTSQTTSVEMQSDSQSLTETVSTGSIRTGLRISNTGPVSFELTNLGVTLQMWEPRVDPGEPTVIGEARTLGTLAPTLTSVALAPGESTPVLELAAENVNAAIVRKFLSKPTNIRYQPAYFDLVDAEGRNFAFLREVTFSRTAGVEIDFGNGTIERYYYATNVDRASDGEFKGVRLVDVLNALDIPVRIEELRNQANQVIGTGITQVRDIPAGAPSRFNFWLVGGNADGLSDGRIDEVTLRAGQGISITYVRDEDQDGIWGFEESVVGTRDNGDGPASSDTDGDGLTDAFESHNTTDPSGTIITAGWDVTIEQPIGPPVTYHVTSNPRNADSDYDGRSDQVEFSQGTDPNKRDTDGDGIDDSIDAYPMQPAIRLYVRPGGIGPDGATWSRAFGSVESAVLEAKARFLDGRADVSEIWVARGRYVVAANRILLDFPVKLYGGFVGGEVKLAERSADAVNNQTELARTTTPGFVIENLTHGVLVDGFTFAANADRAFRAYSIGGVTTISNCLFLNNSTINNSGAAIAASDCNINLLKCVFAGNSASEQAGSSGVFGGAVNLTRVTATLSDCVFENNTVGISVVGGNSGAVRLTDSTALFSGCRFRGNIVHIYSPLPPALHETHGGAVAVFNTNGATQYARFENCQFFDNEVRVDVPVVERYSQRYAGGALAAWNGPLAVVNCVFSGNVAPGFGGAIWRHNSSAAPLYVINSTLVGNRCWSPDSGGRYCAGGGIGSTGTTVIVNSILYFNALSIDRAGVSARLDAERACQASEFLNSGGGWSGFGYLAADNSCIRGIYTHGMSGIGTFDADPTFDSNSMALSSSSPCIDAGRTFYDTDAFHAGYQALPETDVSGQTRITDGNGDGDPKVDVGAYELQ